MKPFETVTVVIGNTKLTERVYRPGTDGLLTTHWCLVGRHRAGTGGPAGRRGGTGPGLPLQSAALWVWSGSPWLGRPVGQWSR